MDLLSAAVRKTGSDAYVIYASSRDPDMRYLTHFTTSDPFVFIKKPGSRGMIIVSQMEAVRAARESHLKVITRSQAGLPEILKTEKDPYQAIAMMISGQAGKKILAPPDFPLALAESLKELGTVQVDKGTVRLMRSRKSNDEIRLMSDVQGAAEKAMESAVSLIRRANVKKGLLYLGHNPLTSEYVKKAMHTMLLQYGCTAVDTIVSCGKETAIPHMSGEGQLAAEEPIVIDLFPVNERSGYYADMTRTVSKGTPSPAIVEMYAVLRDAKHLGISLVKGGVPGNEIHDAVVDFFKDHGYESGTRGFVHNLGHGVGLQVHELPTVGPSGEKLVPGNVITIEPGLYYPGTGGVRLEDMGVVTRKGFEDITNFPEDLVV